MFLMINEIIDGISIKLNLVFGDDYEIYSEEVKQGLKEPCFFIVSLNNDQTPRLGNRYLREQAFDIHYFPGSAEKNKEIYAVAEQLLSEMEYIDVLGDPFRGTKMHNEVVNGVLHFFVNYNTHVYKVTELLDQMDTVQVNNGLKG